MRPASTPCTQPSTPEIVSGMDWLLKNGTTMGPATPAAPTWMCAAVTTPIPDQLSRKQTVWLPGLSVTTALPEPLGTPGDSALPTRWAARTSPCPDWLRAATGPATKMIATRQSPEMPERMRRFLLRMPPPFLRRSSGVPGPPGHGRPCKDLRAGGAEGLRKRRFESEKILEGLPADDGVCVPISHQDDGRAWLAVVVRRHRVPVGPGGRDRQEVAALHGGRQHHVPDQDVARFAVHAGDGHQPARLVPGLVGEERRVARLVEGGPDVVAHPAVDRDVGPDPGDLLDDPDGVEGHHGVAHEEAAGLEGEAGRRHAVAGGLLLGGLGDELGQQVEADRKVPGDVG